MLSLILIPINSTWLGAQENRMGHCLSCSQTFEQASPTTGHPNGALSSHLQADSATSQGPQHHFEICWSPNTPAPHLSTLTIDGQGALRPKGLKARESNHGSDIEWSARDQTALATNCACRSSRHSRSSSGPAAIHCRESSRHRLASCPPSACCSGFWGHAPGRAAA